MICIGQLDYHSLLKQKTTVHIQFIKIRKDFRNQGWGTLFVTKALQHFKRLGFRKVILDSVLDNPNSRFYHRIGFQPSNPDDETEMGLIL